jgi:hypothetical protein
MEPDRFDFADQRRKSLSLLVASSWLSPKYVCPLATGHLALSLDSRLFEKIERWRKYGFF